MVSGLVHTRPRATAYNLRTNNATIEVIIESHGFNNSLAGSLNCPNSNSKHSADEAKEKWIGTYLKDGMLVSHYRLSLYHSLRDNQRANLQ